MQVLPRKIIASTPGQVVISLVLVHDRKHTATDEEAEKIFKQYLATTSIEAIVLLTLRHLLENPQDSIALGILENYAELPTPNPSILPIRNSILLALEYHHALKRLNEVS